MDTRDLLLSCILSLLSVGLGVGGGVLLARLVVSLAPLAPRPAAPAPGPGRGWVPAPHRDLVARLLSRGPIPWSTRSIAAQWPTGRAGPPRRHRQRPAGPSSPAPGARRACWTMGREPSWLRVPHSWSPPPAPRRRRARG